jgi:hypothetical protein
MALMSWHKHHVLSTCQHGHHSSWSSLHETVSCISRFLLTDQRMDNLFISHLSALATPSTTRSASSASAIQREGGLGGGGGGRGSGVSFTADFSGTGLYIRTATPLIPPPISLISPEYSLPLASLLFSWSLLSSRGIFSPSLASPLLASHVLCSIFCLPIPPPPA